jgi:hypothetical protein
LDNLQEHDKYHIVNSDNIVSLLEKVYVMDIEVIKILDKYLPPKGVGTQREKLRIQLYNSIVGLVNNTLDISNRDKDLIEHIIKKVDDYDDTLIKWSNVSKEVTGRRQHISRFSYPNKYNDLIINIKWHELRIRNIINTFKTE